MLRGLRIIILKEVKELMRDPKILLGMIIVPMIMFPIMGLAMRSLFTQVQESMKQITVAVADFDRGVWSQNFTNTLKENVTDVKVVLINASSIEMAIPEMLKQNLTDLIVIPEGFSENITRGTAAYIQTYSIYSGSGIIESTRSSAVKAIIESVKKMWAPDPFIVFQSSIVKGELVPVPPDTLANLAMSQYIVMPITISIILVFAMQLAATSVASEKEEKTLETLLSLPINRFTILMGKLFGSILVALIGAVGYLVGFTYYMGSMYAFTPIEGIEVNLAELGLVPSFTGYLLMGISLFVSLLSALALAVVISAFTEDVRSAQAIVGYIYPLMFIPMFLLMYTDLSMLSLPLKILILAIPYSHPIIAARAAVSGDYMLAVGGIVYVTAFTIVILYIAARFFATEKILTARIKLGKLKWKKKKG